jgi:nucleotide-binding universal stress UspA family protein
LPRPVPSVGARVLLPTDLSPQATIAFLHALKVAVITRGVLHPVHVHDAETPVEWARMPKVREVLIRWGDLDEDSTLVDYEALGLRVEPTDREGRKAADGISAEASDLPWDLLVMHTAYRHMVDRWFSTRVSLNVVRRAKTTTLFLPERGTRLVEPERGDVSLRHVLLPVGGGTNGATEVQAAEAFARAMGVYRAHGTLLHIGSEMPSVELDHSWGWDTRLERGGIVSTIVRVAEEQQSDLIVMVTNGHDSVRDMLFGSITERVIALAPCPVLAIPIDT